MSNGLDADPTGPRMRHPSVRDAVESPQQPSLASWRGHPIKTLGMVGGKDVRELVLAGRVIPRGTENAPLGLGQGDIRGGYHGEVNVRTVGKCELQHRGTGGVHSLRFDRADVHMRTRQPRVTALIGRQKVGDRISTGIKGGGIREWRHGQRKPTVIAKRSQERVAIGEAVGNDRRQRPPEVGIGRGAVSGENRIDPGAAGKVRQQTSSSDVGPIAGNGRVGDAATNSAQTPAKMSEVFGNGGVVDIGDAEDASAGT